VGLPLQISLHNNQTMQNLNIEHIIRLILPPIFQVVVLACLLNILAGCSHETSPERQESALQETYRATPPPEAREQKEKSLIFSDWPRMFGPVGNSRSPEIWVELDWPETGPPLVWEKPAGEGYSCPVIAGERMILLHRIDDWELATCLEAETGDMLWETGWPATYRCRYPYSSGTYCTPIIEANRVYVLGASAQLLCLSLQDGSRIWTRDLEADYDPGELPYGFGATPLLERDRLIVNLGGRQEESGIIAVDKLTGKTIWTQTEERASYCTPVATTVDKQRLVILLTRENLVCLDPDDGRVFWKERFGVRNSPERVNAVSPFLINPHQVLMTFGPGPGARLIEFDGRGDHRVVWATRRGGLESQYTNLLQWENFVLGFSPLTTCELRCIDLDTGEEHWAWHRDHTLRRSMSIQIGTRGMIALGQEGHLISLAPNESGPRLISRVDQPVLEPNCFTQPILSRGLLYVRNEERIKCFSLRPASHDPETLMTNSPAD